MKSVLDQCLDDAAERVWGNPKPKKKETKMRTFVRNVNDKNSFWWEYENGICYNRYGGRHSYYKQDGDIFAEANDWEDLDWSFLIDNASDLGWISPDGTFYGCDYRRHADVAKLFFKKDERQLEEEGWVKVFMDSWRHEKEWFSDKAMITDAQKITLEKLGYEVDLDVCELVTPVQGAVNG